jgi:hypothetical protein
MESKPLKLAVIADAGHVQRFGLAAIDAITGCREISVFSCTNTRTRKKPLRHGAYYALNLLSVRNAWTAGVPVKQSAKRIAEAVEFESGYDGAWQVLPDPVIARLREGGFDAVLKLGMGLLRVPPPEVLPVPILSYHHGDPDRYRGRPAGFWEIAAGETAMGQIVQVIGNRLDAGRVVAFAETRVLPHSYKGTLIESYRHSALLINEAIRAAVSGAALAKPCKGRNYRLPGNWTVAKFALAMGVRKVRRLVYGALFEKKWSVSTAPAPKASVTAVEGGKLLPAPESWTTLKAAPGYTFYADPFFSREPEGILVEALRGTTGRGEIVLVAGEEHRRISPAGGHFSYPYTLDVEGRQIVVPETASWRAPTAYRIEAGGLEPECELRMEPPVRVSDPSLIEREGMFYLFGNDPVLGSSTLMLWCAPSIDGPFRPHPRSPILVSPRGGRMGGRFLEAEGRLIRFGQDLSGSYGDGLVAFEIEALTPSDYRERSIGDVRFTDRRGPHTLSVAGGRLLFDWYREAFSPLAGVRRLTARLDARRRRIG